MRNSKIEEKINKSFSNIVPDVLPNILTKCEEKGGFFVNMEISKSENKRKTIFMPKLVGALAVCVIGVFGFVGYDNNFKIDSIVEFDVNPSIEVQVNKKEKVMDVIPLNDDGKKVVSDMNFKNADLDLAVNALVGSMLRNGYISDTSNSILVSVKNNDDMKREQLQVKITEEISNTLKNNDIEGSIITQTYDDNDEIKKLAEKNSLSEGKVNLINKILSTGIKKHDDMAYNFAELSKMSINDLNLLLDSKKTQITDIKTIGVASEKAYIGKDNAIKIASENANISVENIKKTEIEMDYDDGLMIYEIEFFVGNDKYEYEIDAITGNIIEKEIERNDFDDDDFYDDDFDDKDVDDYVGTSNLYIKKEKAIKIACRNANVLIEDIKMKEIEMDNDDGKMLYEIEFYVGNDKYEYEIDAITGNIIEKEIERNEIDDDDRD